MAGMVGVVMPADLLLLHGFTQTGASWDGVARALGGRYRALAPDLGGGAVGAPSSTASTALAAGRRFVLAGYSMGGRLALALALRRPGAGARARARLRLARARRRRRARGAARGRRGARGPDRGDRRRGVRARVGGAAAVRGPAGGRSPRSPTRTGCGARRPSTRRSCAGSGTGVDAAAVGPAGRARDAGDARGRRARREVPRDRRADGRAAAEREIVVVAGAGHAVALEAPEAVAEAIDRTHPPVP